MEDNIALYTHAETPVFFFVSFSSNEYPTNYTDEEQK